MNNTHFFHNGIDLLNQSGFTGLANLAPGEELVDEITVVRVLHVGQSIVSYLMAERQAAPPIDENKVRDLFTHINTLFNVSELQELCFKLGVSYEDLSGDSKNGKSRELISYMQRRGRLAELATACQKERSHQAWPTFPKTTRLAAIVDKANIAIVVSLAQPPLEDVASFLARENLDANAVLMTNVPDYSGARFLGVENNWHEVTQSFYKTMQIVRRKFPHARRHFFFAAPAALAFALGCAWGTVLQGDELYHFHRDADNRSYYVHVATISRDLRDAP